MTEDFALRPVRESDFPGIAAIETAIGPEAADPRQLAQRERLGRVDPKYPMHWFTAIAPDGTVAGFGMAGKADWLGPDKCRMYIGVLPAYRGRGLGSRLLGYAEAVVAQYSPKSISVTCCGTDDESYQWGLRRGFSFVRQRTESVLDLTKFDPGRFADRVNRVVDQGIEMKVLPFKQAEPYWGELYEISTVTFRDVPFTEADAESTSYETWLEEYFSTVGETLVVLAIDRGQVVGMTEVNLPTVEGQGAGIGYTGVLKSHRGRGLAWGVKIRGAQAAKEAGVKWIRTHNDPGNSAILAINDRMGFQWVPGPRILEKKLR